MFCIGVVPLLASRPYSISLIQYSFQKKIMFYDFMGLWIVNYIMIII